MLANAITTANSDDPTAIRDALAKTKDFVGATGKISFPTGQRVPQKSVAMVKVMDGQISFDSEVVPEKIPAP
jgi:branched-chain amino acid transport system substrate-binding protein